MTRRIALTAALALALWLLPAHSTTQALDPMPWMRAVYILDEEVGLAQRPLEELWGDADAHMFASLDAWYPPDADGRHQFVGWAGKCGAPAWGTPFYSDWQAYELRAAVDGLPTYVSATRTSRPDVRNVFSGYCLSYWGGDIDAQPGVVARIDLRPMCPRGWTCRVQLRLLNRIGQIVHSNTVQVPIP